jgi:hypothetical protein
METSQETSISKTEEIGYRPNDQTIDIRFPAGAEIFIFTNLYILPLGPTHHPIQWVSMVNFLAGKAVRV